MNLDIMSLMAASAAVSHPRAAQGDSTTALPNTLGEGGEGPSFLSILQGISGSLQNTDDIQAAALTDALSAPTEIETPLSTQAATPPTGDLAPNIEAIVSGNPLPESGNDLPQDSALLVDQIAAGTVLATPTTLVAADVRLPPTTQSALGPQTAGWFSQRSTGSAQPTASVQGAAVTGSTLESASAATALSAVDLSTALGDERGMPNPQAGQSAQPRSALLADRWQSLTAQSAGLSLSALAAEPAALEAPRGALTAPISNLSSPTAASMPTPLSAPINLNQAGWDKALGQRLVFMAANGLESAELRLDPPQLGTVHVKLSMQGDQAQVLLQAANPLARDAMETALPRLRDLLGSEGLQLDSAQVTDRDSGDQQRETHAQPGTRADIGDEEGTESSDSQAVQSPVETLTTTTGVISERV